MASDRWVNWEGRNCNSAIPYLQSQIKPDGLRRFKKLVLKSKISSMALSTEYEIVSRHSRPVHCIALERCESLCVSAIIKITTTVIITIIALITITAIITFSNVNITVIITVIISITVTVIITVIITVTVTIITTAIIIEGMKIAIS
jgi:hypothetical protein